MDLFIYIMLFMMGTVFGSFFTLAVYRIPLKKNITHERSFCTSCGHRLEFLDLVPVLSYIFIKGKCRYCGEKIRIRYLLLEVLSGLVFVITYISLNIHFPYFDVEKLMYFAFFVMLYITLAITAGIDKEYKKIHLGVILFGFIMQTVYILYLYILKDINIYRYSIYFVFILLMLIINKKVENTNYKLSYMLQILLLSFYIMYFTEIKIFIAIAILTLVATILKMFIDFYNKKQSNENIKRKDTEELKNENQVSIQNKLPIGFFMSLSSIAIIIITNFIKYY